MVRATLSGPFPRDEQLIKATWNFDKKLLTAAQLEADVERAAKETVDLQKRLGFADATDGSYRWQDLHRTVAESTKGIEVGGLLRFHETNSFLRRPVLAKPFGPKDFDAKRFTASLVATALRAAPRPKVLLPSPYFFLRSADDRAYGEPEAAGRAIADVVNQAALASVKAGAKVIQFNDASLLHEPNGGAQLAVDLLARAVKGVEADTTYYPYAGAATAAWDALTKAPTGRIGVDFTVTDREDLGALPKKKTLLAGLVDGRSSLIEPLDAVATFVAELAETYGGKDLQVTHAYDLEFVPSSVGRQKLELLAAASARVQEVAQ